MPYLQNNAMIKTHHDGVSGAGNTQTAWSDNNS